jgi:hypothetical protein
MRRNGSLNESTDMNETQLREQEERIQELGKQRMWEFVDFLKNVSQELDYGLPQEIGDMNWSDWSSNHTPYEFTGNSSNWTWLNYTYNSTPGFPQDSEAENSTEAGPANASGANDSGAQREWQRQQLLNQSAWNWTSNFTDRGNWSAFNNTWNETRLAQEYLDRPLPSPSGTPGQGLTGEQRKAELLNRTRGGNGTAAQIARAVASSAGSLLLFALAAGLGFAVLAGAYYARGLLPASGGKPAQTKARELFRKVNIGEVIRNCKGMGAQGRHSEAVIYGYNELAEYIAFVFRVYNDPSRTAREFRSSFDGMDADLESLSRITSLFEKAAYAGGAGPGDFAEFVSALERLAKSGG